MLANVPTERTLEIRLRKRKQWLSLASSPRPSSTAATSPSSGSGRLSSTFNTARVSGKTYMPGLRFHSDVSAGQGRAAHQRRRSERTKLGRRLRRVPRPFADRGEASRLMDYACWTRVVAACRHDTQVHTSERRTDAINW